MHIRSLSGTVLLGVVALCQCARDAAVSKPNPGVADTLIPAESVGTHHGRISYGMSDLVCALPHVWEVDPPFRGSYLRRLYPERYSGDPSAVPDNYVSIPIDGAQTGFTVTRLENDLVVVTTHHDVEGDHDRVYILRRVPGSWLDLTSAMFPYPVPMDSGVRVRGLRDKSILMRLKYDGPERRFLWNGRRYEEGNATTTQS